jgi:hypothetical protein
VWGDLSARERDALIAWHVMGWVVVGLSDGPYGWRRPTEASVHVLCADFRPTADIAAAFRALEKARNGRCVQITSRADGWHVAIYPLDGSLDPASASGPLPEAICHAALRACGVDV